MRRSGLALRGLLASTAVAVGLSTGSIVGAAQAHADTTSLGDCSLTAKLLTDRQGDGKVSQLSVRGVGAVQCKSRKAAITATIELKRNGTVVKASSGTWTNPYNLGNEPILTSVHTTGSLQGCAKYQSTITVSIPGLGQASVTSGLPTHLCA